jgi:hypothetical protein
MPAVAARALLAPLGYHFGDGRHFVHRRGKKEAGWVEMSIAHWKIVKPLDSDLELGKLDGVVFRGLKIRL